MVDIHTHILPLIDDGSDSLNASLEMILGEITNGVSHIFCTPHALRTDISPYTLEDLKNKFNEFKKRVEDNYPLKLYLGQEIFVRNHLVTSLRKKEVLTMNDTNYILLELPYNFMPENFEETLYACKVLGLKIIIAHVERYSYLSFDDIEKFAEEGILLQVNSNSIVASAKNVRSKIHKLFKKNLISFVASDIHSFRNNTMKEAYEFIQKKYGEKTARDVFYNNGRKYLNLEK